MSMKRAFFIIAVIVLSFLLIVGTAACQTISSSGIDSVEREKSAAEKIYEAAKDLGYEGTLQEFLAQCKGLDGVSVTGAFIDERDCLVLTKSNGESVNLGKIKGADGKDGEDGQNGQNGVGIQSTVINDDGELVVTLTDGTVKNCGKVVGEDGQKGENGAAGAQGQAGRGVESVRVTDGGSVFVVYSDSDEEILIGKVVINASSEPVSVEIDGDGYWVIGGVKTDVLARGADGADGSDGSKGSDGKKGEDGLSAYDIYCKYYDYDGNEKDWIDDLIAGRLSSAEYFTVKVVCDKGTYILKVLENATVDLTDVDTSCDGYVLTGWTCGGDPFDLDTPITASVVINAVYEVEEIEAFTEAVCEEDPISLSAMTRKKITVPEVTFSYFDLIRFVWGSGDVSITVYSVLTGDKIGDEIALSWTGADYTLDLSDYDAYGQPGNEGILLDVTYRAESGLLTVTPISSL